MSQGALVENCTTGGISGNGSVIYRCQAVGNTNYGIQLTSAGGMVLNCEAQLNTGNGIYVNSDCVVRGNNSNLNGPGASVGTGIMVSGNHCVIEDNNVTGNDTGISVSNSVNLIIRNKASNNTTNYFSGASNTVGDIITTSLDPAFVSTNSFANLSY